MPARSSTGSERFLERFLLPLIRGGTVKVGRPLGGAELQALEAESAMPGDAALEVERARRVRARELWLYPVELPWDASSARLAAAAHNILFLSHPDAERWTASAAGLRQVARFTARLLRLRPPQGDVEAVARHTIAGGLFDLQREDVVLDTWLMVYSFRGQEPPPGLRRFPSLRRVREQRSRLLWVADPALAEVQLELLVELLRASPLTDLLTPLRPRPPFAWREVAEYLRRPALARLVCHHCLELGLAAVEAPLCTAFWELVGSPAGVARREAVRVVMGMLLFLCAAAALGGNSLPVPSGSGANSPLGLLATVVAVAAHCRLLPATLEDRPRLELERLGAEQAKILGQGTLNELAARLRAALE